MALARSDGLSYFNCHVLPRSECTMKWLKFELITMTKKLTKD